MPDGQSRPVPGYRHDPPRAAKIVINYLITSDAALTLKSYVCISSSSIFLVFQVYMPCYTLYIGHKEYTWSVFRTTKIFVACKGYNWNVSDVPTLSVPRDVRHGVQRLKSLSQPFFTFCPEPLHVFKDILAIPLCLEFAFYLTTN